MQYTVDGLVIRETESGENDKRITLLTPDKGRLTVSAKGARSLKSKYMNSVSLFTYGNYEITERQGFSWLGGASVTEPFYGLRSDIDSLALASYIVDVAGELCGEGEPADELLRLTLNTLYAIEKKLKPFEQIKAAYELRAMSMSGYLPMLDECGDCGKKDASLMYMDVMNGMLRCEDCLHKINIGRDVPIDDTNTAVIILPMSHESVSAARYITTAPIQRVLSFVMSRDMLSELAKMTEAYLIHHLEKSFSSLEFYKTLKDNPMKG